MGHEQIIPLERVQRGTESERFHPLVPCRCDRSKTKLFHIRVVHRLGGTIRTIRTITVEE